VDARFRRHGCLANCIRAGGSDAGEESVFKGAGYVPPEEPVAQF